MSGISNASSKPWKSAQVFLVDTVIGVAIFLIVAAGAVGLSFLINWLKNLGIDPIVIWCLKTCEYMILLADVVLLARYLWLSVVRGWQVV